MFSRASVILSTIGLMPTRSLLILVGYLVTCYSAVGTQPTGMLACFFIISYLKHDLIRSSTDIYVKFTWQKCFKNKQMLPFAVAEWLASLITKQKELCLSLVNLRAPSH